MNPIANQSSFAPFSFGAFAGGRSFQAEQTRAGSLSQTQNTELTITTDEGDIVTLSLASAMEANAGIYRNSSFEEGRSASSQTAFFEFSSSRSMEIEINGELNEEELEDIREAVKAIGGMIDDFLSGDLQEMAEDEVILDDVLAVIRSGEILENYAEHRRGPCCLLLGYTAEGRPLHVVCTTIQPVLVLITVYEPRAPKWITPTQRRSRS